MRSTPRVKDVHRCARCGAEHLLTFQPLSNPPEAFTHWATCPTTREPVLLQVTWSSPGRTEA